MADLDEVFGEHVEQEAADELVWRERARVAGLGAEGDALVGERDEPAVGDAGAVGVAAEVVDDGGRTGEGRLGKDVLVQGVEPVEQLLEDRKSVV